MTTELKILVVEDSPPTSNIIKLILKDSGYEVFCSTNAQQASEVLNRNTIDLILLDVMLPGTDGFTLCNELKMSDKFKDIPIVFCTAKGEREDVVKAIKAGADDYVIKPFTKRVLISKIATVLGKKKTGKHKDITSEIEDL